MASLPVTIFQYRLSPYDEWDAARLGRRAADHLGVLALSITARVARRAKDQSMSTTMSRPPSAPSSGGAETSARSRMSVQQSRLLLRRQPRAEERSTSTLPHRQVTGLIGPSGCGKSTLLRVLNRMYDLYPGQRATGEVLLDGENILNPARDLNALRARVGMVFQKPTPFPMSIYEQHRLRRAALREAVARPTWTSASKRSLRRGGAVGRGQGQAQRHRPGPVRRPAAAPVHRPHHRGATRGDPVRRAGLGARPDLAPPRSRS